MTRLLLIRHGQGYCNVERTIEGRATCRGLTELGQRQAAAVAERLVHDGVQASMLYASPIARAWATAQPIAAQLRLEVHAAEAFEEVRPGEAEGLTWDQYSAFFGNTEGWDPAVPFAPGAEAWNDFARRVGAALDEVIERHPGETVVVVAHGGVIDASMFHFFGLDPNVQSPIDFEKANTSITEWERRSFTLADDEQTHRWRLCRYNDAAHLPRP
jgi:2,3-bisphosphoglycerate-dependent phosphoglycerate mutase